MDDLPNGKKILFFAPHPDDDACYAGATIRALTRRKNTVTCAYVANSPRGVLGGASVEEKVRIRKAEAESSCSILGSEPIFLDLDWSGALRRDNESVQKIKRLIEEQKPDIVFLPPSNDAHPTHALVSAIASEVVRSAGIGETWTYESWTPLEKPNFIFSFGEPLLKTKIKAIRAHKSQLERLDMVGAMVALNTFRGIAGRELLGGFAKSYPQGKKYGEAFFIQNKS